MLLPRPPADEEAPEDPRQELVERLLEYRRLKEAAQSLAEIHSVRRGIWTRPPQPLPSGAAAEETVDLGEVSLFDLLGALRTVLVRYEREHPPALLLRGESFSVRQQVERLLSRLEVGKPFDLLADLRTRSCRAEAVVAFLAILELARMSLARLHQTTAGEILLYRTTRELGRDELETLEA